MLKIITPCSRPSNLTHIFKTIPEDSEWIICCDNENYSNITQQDLLHTRKNIKILKCPTTGFCGIEARNYALDNINFCDNDFILNHDDDNIIHEDLFSHIFDVLSSNHSIVTWGQLDKNKKIRLRPTAKPKACRIDTACYMIQWGINKHVRHVVGNYTHDGIYAEECAKNGSILVIDKYLSYYNYLSN